VKQGAAEVRGGAVDLNVGAAMSGAEREQAQGPALVSMLRVARFIEDGSKQIRSQCALRST